MAGIPSIGDILMLSQLAWRIGCAFTSGRAGAPAEFKEVENELHSLTKALTLLAEALDEDDSIISRADEKTKEGLEKMLECCQQTLENLNSFVGQYQEIKKPDGESHITTQRSWKRLLIRNYKTIGWTGEGGTIQALRNMLHMHVNSISVTVLSLQRLVTPPYRGLTGSPYGNFFPWVLPNSFAESRLQPLPFTSRKHH